MKIDNNRKINSLQLRVSEKSIGSLQTYNVLETIEYAYIDKIQYHVLHDVNYSLQNIIF